MERVSNDLPPGGLPAGLCVTASNEAARSTAMASAPRREFPSPAAAPSDPVATSSRGGEPAEAESEPAERLPSRDPEPPARGLADDEDSQLTFREIVAKYEKKIYNLVLRQIGDREEAEDLTQETFLNAYRSFAAFRGDCKVHTWLCQIALNQCKNRFRQRDRRRVMEGPSLDAPISPEEGIRPLEIPDWEQSPQDVLFRNEMYRYVLKAIDSLPDEYRQVITLCDLHHMSYLQIAQITSLSLEAVKTRIHRGRLMLRRKLDAYLKS